MAKKPKPEGKKYSYMDTYGDLVTLLMCFFVLLFAMSNVEEAKYNAFVEALSNRFGSAPLNLSSVVNVEEPVGDDFGEQEPTTGETLDPVENLPQDLRQAYEDITQHIEENALQGEVSIEVGESGVIFIRLSDNLLFGGDSSVLRAQAMDFIDFMGAAFVSIEDQIFQIDILGHTASVPGSATDDWMLSSERSGRVASYMERQVGFSTYKMHTEGYGRHYPVADNSSEDGRQRNRRVDMLVISNNADNFYEALAEARKVYFPSDDVSLFEGTPEELPGNMVDTVPPVGQDVDLSTLTDEQLRELYNSSGG